MRGYNMHNNEIPVRKFFQEDLQISSKIPRVVDNLIIVIYLTHTVHVQAKTTSPMIFLALTQWCEDDIYIAGARCPNSKPKWLHQGPRVLGEWAYHISPPAREFVGAVSFPIRVRGKAWADEFFWRFGFFRWAVLQSCYAKLCVGPLYRCTI